MTEKEILELFRIAYSLKPHDDHYAILEVPIGILGEIDTGLGHLYGASSFRVVEYGGFDVIIWSQDSYSVEDSGWVSISVGESRINTVNVTGYNTGSYTVSTPVQP